MTFLIRSLDIGGAERQLAALAQGLKARGREVRVLTFYPGGALRPGLTAAGVEVEDLGKSGRWDVLPFLLRLGRALRRHRPHVLYSWLPTANVIAAGIGRMVGTPMIVWGVRASDIDPRAYDGLVRLELWLSRWASRWADRIICNSQCGLAHHKGLGYPPHKMVVIENGIDTARFAFDARGRAALRELWGVPDDQFLIGLVARLDPMKDHETFLKAAARLAARRADVRFVCIGDGPPEYAQRLEGLAEDLNLASRVAWAGGRGDMAAAYSALDILASSSSFGEGFSNAIAEAMACERLCVVTDVGDSARIVGETGWVVPARDPVALAAAWEQALSLSAGERAERGRHARARVVSRFSLAKMVERTLQVLDA